MINCAQKLIDFKQERLGDLHFLIRKYGYDSTETNQTIDIFMDVKVTKKLKTLFGRTITKVGFYYLVDNKGGLTNYDCISIQKLCDLIDILTFCYNDEVNKAKNILIKAGYTITKKGEK